MNAAAGTTAYARIGVESGALAADPQKLISMLYQGALLAIANAKNAILRKDIPAKGKAISHALRIIDDGLKASLNKDVGGDLALSLDALYDYMCSRLVASNISNDLEGLDEVSRLLNELKGAWDSISQTVVASTIAPAPQMKAPSKQPALVYGRM